MSLVIIGGSARPQTKSNTAKIISAFSAGYEACGERAEVWYLSDRKQWAGAAEAFYQSDDILIAMPLYVENIPGILLEFLEGLSPKKNPGTRLAFIVQGGFPEASQSRCCEKYLERLPQRLGCAYAGTLIKGDMFGLGLTDDQQRRKMLAPFTETGRRFATSHCFEKQAVNAFAAPEYLPKNQIRLFKLFGHSVQKHFMGKMAKKMGCTGPLDARPYENKPKGE